MLGLVVCSSFITFVRASGIESGTLPRKDLRSDRFDTGFATLNKRTQGRPISALFVELFVCGVDV